METVAAKAAPVLEGVPHSRPPRMIAAVARPATKAAAVYLQIAPTKAETPKPIGRPAYQKAGTSMIQNEMLHAAATPAGPQDNPTKNKHRVKANPAMLARIKRSGFPMEKWIQPTVLQSSIAPIPGPNSSKILPDSDHFGPSTSLTASLPTKLRSALAAMPTNATIPSELARYRRKRAWS